MEPLPTPNQNLEPVAESILEAMLFVGGPPVDSAQLALVLNTTIDDQIVRAVAELNQRYHRQRRPYEIRRSGQGYQMLLRPQFASLPRRLYGRTRQVRLSQAAVEVLSLVAYKQPVTVQEVDAIRGIDSASILRQLRRRNLIETVNAPEADPTADERGVKFQTTRRFLELFHLASLEDLPRLQETLPI